MVQNYNRVRFSLPHSIIVLLGNHKTPFATLRAILLIQDSRMAASLTPLRWGAACDLLELPVEIGLVGQPHGFGYVRNLALAVCKKQLLGLLDPHGRPPCAEISCDMGLEIS